MTGQTAQGKEYMLRGVNGRGESSGGGGGGGKMWRCRKRAGRPQGRGEKKKSQALEKGGKGEGRIHV